MTDPIQRRASLISADMVNNTPVQATSKGGGIDKPDKLRKACRDFESIFIQQMMQQMRQTVPQDGLFSGGQAEQIYTSMLDGEMAKNFAENRGLGLADVLYRQLAAIQNYTDEKK